MKKRLSSALLSGLVLLAGTAHAVTLFSPPLVAEGNNVLDCYLVNVSQQPRNVNIQILSREGTVLLSVPTVLAPGQEDVARAPAAQLPRYCKFIAQGLATHFRASVLVRQDGVGAISALPAN